MANVLYDAGREGFATALIDFVNDTIKIALVDTGTYTFSQAHDFYNDVSGVASTATLASKTATAGVLDAADTVFSSVGAGASCEAIVMYKDTGVSSTSRLIAYIDTVSSGLPVTPNGGNITVQWDNGANKICKI